MTVQELIDELSNLPPDHIVVRNGYEGGVEEITHVSLTNISLNVNKEWYYGAHEIDPEGDTKAIYIS